MQANLQFTSQELQKKEAQLRQLRTHLKSQFFGIDAIIDQVVDALSGWYLMPDLQERPLVINLWGLTGVGKTALVQEILRFLDFENFSFFFNFGEDSPSDDLFDTLDDFNDTHNGRPLALVLDEFQSAQTIDQKGEESKSDQMLWTLLDSGRAQLKPRFSSLYRVYNAYRHLEELLQSHTIEVKNGKVVKGLPAFEQMCASTTISHQRLFPGDNKTGSEEDQDWFIPMDVQRNIQTLRRQEFTSIIQVTKALENCNAAECMQFLQRVLDQGPQPRKINVSKALIFVLGNLDEAFRMAGQLTSELSADEFREQSLKIGMGEVRAALQKRFRNEQIARLGNIHLIYPALGQSHFYQIIDQWIQSKLNHLQQRYGVSIEVGDSLRDFLYQEGVIPVQGTRPLFSTLHQHLGSKFSHVLLPLLTQFPNTTKIELFYHQKAIQARYLEQETVLHCKSIDMFCIKPRKPIEENTDLRALISVHEAGHALASIYLNGLFPLKVQNFSSEPGSGGFTLIKYPYELSSRRLIWHKASVLLAGQQAEELLFGRDLISDGASKDLERATTLLSQAIRADGLGSFTGSYQPESIATPHSLYDRPGEAEEELAASLNQCRDQARRLLEREKPLLLHIAQALLDHSTLHARDLRELCQRYGIGPQAKHVAVPGYRQLLHEELEEQLDAFDPTLLNATKTSQ